jgi:hypothetical protein
MPLNISGRVCLEALDICPFRAECSTILTLPKLGAVQIHEAARSLVLDKVNNGIAMMRLCRFRVASPFVIEVGRIVQKIKSDSLVKAERLDMRNEFMDEKRWHLLQHYCRTGRRFGVLLSSFIGP